MEHIAVIREAAGVSQTALARNIGVTQGAVARMEMSGKYPNASKLPAIADTLGCSIDALFGRGPTPPDNTSLPQRGG